MLLPTHSNDALWMCWWIPDKCTCPPLMCGRVATLTEHLHYCFYTQLSNYGYTLAGTSLSLQLDIYCLKWGALLLCVQTEYRCVEELLSLYALTIFHCYPSMVNQNAADLQLFSTQTLFSHIFPPNLSVRNKIWDLLHDRVTGILLSRLVEFSVFPYSKGILRKFKEKWTLKC